MSKPGPKVAVSDSKIAAAIIDGRSDREIARALHVGRDRVAKIRKLPTEGPIKAVPVPNVDRIKAACRLELSQEEARSEFSDQLAEYTNNYRMAMRDGDPDGAKGWAVLRMHLLDNMIRISGLDQTRPAPEPTTQERLADMTDEEVERRAREILAKRQ